MQYSTARRIAVVIATVACCCSSASAFTILFQSLQKKSPTAKSLVDAAPTTTLHSFEQPSPSSGINPQLSSSTALSRRSILSTAAMAPITLFLRPANDCAAAASVATKEELIADLSTSLAKLTQIPLLLQQSEWDKVRTILKTPPIAQLWNLGESQNTLVKLAKETGNFDLLELKDDLAISLQMTDQYSYDNVFIYYQPGNGKVKTKEPLEMANKAISQLKEALDLVNQ